MTAAATKQKPATPTIESQIEDLHQAIDALVEAHVDKLKAANPLLPRTVLHAMAIARADGTARCKCGVWKHLFGKKPNAV